MFTFDQLPPSLQPVALQSVRESTTYRYYLEQLADSFVEETEREWESVPIESKVMFRPLVGVEPPVIEGVKFRAKIYNFREISYLFEAAGIERELVDPNKVRKVLVFYPDERGVEVKVAFKGDYTEREEDAVINLTRLWAIFISENLWAEAEDFLMEQMADEPVRRWAVERVAKFDEGGNFVSL